jgi:putative ABC transport system permease protein
MNIWRSLSHGVRVLTHRAAADEQISNEVDHYVELAAAEHVRRGLAPEAAVRAARIEIGNPTAARETVRSYGWENAVDMFAADVRYALRRLRNNPAFSVVAVLTLGLGIGATTAIFSAIDPILIEPLPYPKSHQLVVISDRTDDGSPLSPTFGTYAELHARARSAQALAAIDHWQPALTGTTEPERLAGERVTANYFRLLGIQPAVGRGFADGDDEPGRPNIVVLSARLVARRFAGDQAIVGKSIRLNDDQYLVIGVMPANFTDLLSPTADIWTPLRDRAPAPFNSVEWGHHYRIVGRLAASSTAAELSRELAAVAHTPVPEFGRPPWADLRSGLSVQRLQDEVTHEVRPTLLAVVGAVGLLLLIACVNVTNLLIAARTQRRAEMAMRVALGAGGGRLLRQQLTETLVLAIIGGALGLVLARIGVRAFVAVSPPGLPRVDAIRLSGQVFAFAAALTTLIGIAIGLAASIGSSRGVLHQHLQAGSRRTAGGHARARSTLVVAEMALALVLLASAGLLMRSLERLFAVEPGFDPSHALSMQVVAVGHAFDSDTTRRLFFEQALDAVRRVPGVSSAAFASQLPLTGGLDGYGYELASKPAHSPSDSPGSALRYEVTPSYFATMRVRLIRGRLFDSNDGPGHPDVLVISESFARRAFGAENPIGQRIRFGPEMQSNRPWDVIVGVVGDVKQQSLALGETDAFYVPTGQWWWVDYAQSLVVRTSGEPAALAPSIKRAIWSVNPNQPIQRVMTMESIVAASASQRRFALAVIETFALAALVLAAIGMYGVVSGSVSERTREIGIRVALGATPGGVVQRVVGGALALAAAGAMLGLGGAAASSRLLETMLFGTSRVDPATYLGVTALLGVVVVLASWVPARRAARVDPAITLRSE